MENTKDAQAVSVGMKIRSLRKIRGISLQQLAEEMSMSYSFLSGLENGKHSISLTNLQRFASYFDVDMIYFYRRARARPCMCAPVRRST
ncbi:MAG: helix-turn-helix transcriptional regulator [Ruthenibacterium sp.]